MLGKNFCLGKRCVFICMLLWRIRFVTYWCHNSESRNLLSWHICEARLGPCYFFICLGHISARQCTLKFLIYDTWSTQFSESQVCRFEQPTFLCITLLGVKVFMQYVWFPAALCVWWSLYTVLGFKSNSPTLVKSCQCSCCGVEKGSRYLQPTSVLVLIQVMYVDCPVMKC